jgi:hypothetical protein
MTARRQHRRGGVAVELLRPRLLIASCAGHHIMRPLLTAAALVLGLAPAIAQHMPRDAGRESPLAAGLGSSKQAQVHDCTGMWKRADVRNKGILDGKELDQFRSVLSTVDTNKDGKISQSEFMTACQKGELKNVQL